IGVKTYIIRQVERDSPKPGDPFDFRENVGLRSQSAAVSSNHEGAANQCAVVERQHRTARSELKATQRRNAIKRRDAAIRQLRKAGIRRTNTGRVTIRITD